MQRAHKRQMQTYTAVSPILGQLLFASAILSDVIGGKVTGRELNAHVLDVKEILANVVGDLHNMGIK